MRYFLYLVSLFSILCSGAFFYHAKSSMHEVVAAVFFLTAAVCLLGGALVSRLDMMVVSGATAKSKELSDSDKNFVTLLLALIVMGFVAWLLF